MITLHSQQTNFTKDGIEIIKKIYNVRNVKLKRNTKQIRWTANYLGEFGNGYTMKHAVNEVKWKIKQKTLNK